MNSIINIPNITADYTFSSYQARQKLELTPSRIIEKLATLKKANNFNWVENNWLSNSYEGFGVITMVADLPENTSLIARLMEIQNEFYLKSIEKNSENFTSKFYQLPANSYHQTVANLLSNERFQTNVIERDLLKEFPEIIQEAFDEIDEEDYFQPIPMKMIGLSVFGTCIAMLGNFDNEDDYQRITDFRDCFYEQEILQDLDIKMTRPFIGHITLTYIEADLSEAEKENLGKIIVEINEKLALENNIFYINSSSLRRYHHLAEFLTEKNYPKILI